MPSPKITIGVFDSGFGGLTVLRSLLPRIPGARYIYLGDTARLPYGSKSRETIARYAVSSAKFLHQQGAELLVVACNTATALALDDIQHALPIPVIGVVEPGAQAALQSIVPRLSFQPEHSSPLQESSLRPEHSGSLQELSIPPEPGVPRQELSFRPEHSGSRQELSFRPERSGVEKPASLPPSIDPPQTPFAPGRDSETWVEAPPRPGKAHVLVLATAATVQSHAYTRALNALGLESTEKACPLLVPLVEEGWTDHPVTDEVLRIYLGEALAAAPATKTLLLGCTHYPLLEPAIRRTLEALGAPLALIDSADATAQAAAALVARHFPALDASSPPTCTFYATDSVEKFQRLGSAFLGQPVSEVTLIDLGG